MERTPYNREMDSLQRDGMPCEDEPETGSCWNCDHMAEVRLGGKVYQLCVEERDRHNGGETGDVYEADDSTRNCEDWDDFEA